MSIDAVGKIAPTRDSPESRYLVALSQGHPPVTSQLIAGFGVGPGGRDDALRLARLNPTFAALEQVYIGNSLLGTRPALAAALIEHETLGSVQRLVTVRDNPDAPPSEQVKASNSLLDRSTLGSRGSGTASGSSLTLNAAQVTLLVLQMSPQQLRSVLATGDAPLVGDPGQS